MEQRRGLSNSPKNGADDWKDAHHDEQNTSYVFRDYSARNEGCRSMNSDNNMMSPSLMPRNSLEDGSQGSEISGLDHQLLSMEKSASGRFNSDDNTNGTPSTNTGCLSCSRQRRDDYGGNDFGECHQQHQQKKMPHQLQKKQQDSKKMCGRQVDRASPFLERTTEEIDIAEALSSKTQSAFSNVFLNLSTSSSASLPVQNEDGRSDRDEGDVTRRKTSDVRTCRQVENKTHFFSGMPRAIWIHLGILIFLSLSLQGTLAVRINSLSVPEIVRNGTEDSVILDCDYNYEEHEKKGLVIKWYLKNMHHKEKLQVYQWIPHVKAISLGILKGKVNLDYKADVDDYKAGRALQIIRPTTELTGDWMCQVSSFEGEALRVARMIVFAPEEEMEMRVVENRRGRFVNISCWATRVSPKPIMTFYNEEQQVPEVVVKYEEYENGVYDVMAYKIFEDATLSSMIGSVFDCELAIPSVNYVRRRTTVFEPGSLELKDAMWMSVGQSRVSWDSRRWFLPFTFLLTLTFSLALL